MDNKLSSDVKSIDWLIESNELTNQTLVKQTPRFDVYKANWHGDVLVYKPKKSISITISKQTNNKLYQTSDKQTILTSPTPSSCLSSPSLSPISSSFGADGGYESGYSSCSSTPNYTTNKNHLVESKWQTKFTFPSAETNCQIDENNNDLSPNECNNNNNNYLSSCSQLKPSFCINQNSFAAQNNQLIDVCHIDDTKNFDLTREFEKQEDYLNSWLNDNEAKCYTNEGDFTNNQLFKEQVSNIRLSNNSSNKQTNLTINTNNNSKTSSSQSSSLCWSEINELRLIAHENFMLFMGYSRFDCFKAYDDKETQQVLVMQNCQSSSSSLYSILHQTSYSTTKINFFLNSISKLSIVKQIVNAMTYLHSKNIVHGKLTSTNIYVCQPNNRVKINLIDCDSLTQQTTTTTTDINNESVKLNLNSLTYLSPQIIKTLTVNKHLNLTNKRNVTSIQFNKCKLTKSDDVYSYGTLLYELFEKRFPFTLKSSTQTNQTNSNTNLNAYQLIHKIGLGLIAEENLSLSHGKQTNNSNVKTTLNCPALIELTIASCWSPNSNKRPTFRTLNN